MNTIPSHGDFVRPRPAGNSHIADVIDVPLHGSALVTMACGQRWSTAVLDPAPRDPGDNPLRPCDACWEAM